MKLVKKLLPIATIGSVAAIVTPLFTSCSQHQPFIIDGENFYIPTVSQAIPDYKTHPTGYDIPDAEKLYYQNIKNNPEVLFQDIQASTSYLMYNTKHQGDEEVKFIKQFNSCNIQQKFSGLEVDITKKQLSYRFDTKLEIYGAKFDSLEYVFDFVLSLNINIKKLEFRLVYDDTTIPGRWVFGPAAELLSNWNDDFELEMTANGKVTSDGPASTWCTFNNETINVTMLTLETAPAKWQFIMESYLYYGMFVLGSFHMANILAING